MYKVIDSNFYKTIVHQEKKISKLILNIDFFIMYVHHNFSLA